MPVARRIAVVVTLLVLAVPALAVAQAQPVPESGGLSTTPPSDLSGGSGSGGSQAGGKGPRARARLPNTGADPRQLMLTGIILILLGTGLRLRTADAELY